MPRSHGEAGAGVRLCGENTEQFRDGPTVGVAESRSKQGEALLVKRGDG